MDKLLDRPRLRREDTPAVKVPMDYPTATIFVDESGSKGSGDQFFVVGAVKTRYPGRLGRSVEQIRDDFRFRGEIKFGEVTKSSLPMQKRLVEAIAESDARIGAFVVDKSTSDPFEGCPRWEGHSWTTATLLRGLINKRELVAVLLDGISTPKEISFEEHVRSSVNNRFRETSVVSAVSLNSKTSDGLQLADLIASSIAYERRFMGSRSAAEYATQRSPKAELARYVARAFDVPDFQDRRTSRLSIETMRPRLVMGTRLAAASSRGNND